MDHGPSFDRAQRAHDNAEPPEYWAEEIDYEPLIDAFLEDFDTFNAITTWPDKFFDLQAEISHLIARHGAITYGPFLSQGYIDQDVAKKFADLQTVIRDHIETIIREG